MKTVNKFKSGCQKTLQIAVFISVFAGLFVSCSQPTNSTQKRGGTGGTDEEVVVPSAQANPRLMSLTIECEDEETEFVLADRNGSPVAFNSNTFTYTVQLTPGEINPKIKLVATAAASFIVNYNDRQEFVPESGDVAIITAVSQSAGGLGQNYVITFTAGDLQAALLSSIQLSVGIIPDFAQENTEYAISLPYVQGGDVAAYVSGVYPNSAFTFSPSAHIILARDNSEESEDTRLKGSMLITVSAPGCSPTAYTLDFSMQEPLPSNLNGITLSHGVLTQSSTTPTVVPFSTQPVFGSYQYITLPAGVDTFVIHADKKASATVVFTYNPPLNGTLLSDSHSAAFSGPFISPNNRFTITVNDGASYTNTTYNFQILQSDLAAAVLSGITVAGDGVLAQREPNGTNGSGTFSDAHFVYNLNFESPAARAQITAVAGVGAGVTIHGLPQQTVGNIGTSMDPIHIMVEQTGRLASVYTVYPKLIGAETAVLTNLTVVGGVLADGADQPVSFAPATNNYNVRVFLNAANPTLIVNAEAAALFSVSYPNGNFIDAVTAATDNSTIVVRVEGGANYEPGVYTLTIHTVEPKTPRLTTLGLNGALDNFSPAVLYYTKTIASSSTPTAVELSWIPNSDVSAVYYSVDHGDNWTGPAATPVTSIGSLNNGDSQTVYVKACAEDGAEIIYVVNLIKPHAFLTGISVNGVSLTPATFMSPAYYAIHTAVNPLLTNGFSIAVEAANAPNAEYTWHGAASSSGNQATVSVLTAGHPKTVTLTVQVSGVSSTYTLHFYKPLAYYYQEGASAGGTGETSDSPFHLLSDALNRAKTTGINKVEILGELTAASSLGNAATLFCFNAGYGTADHPFIIRNFYFDGQGTTGGSTTGGKRIVSVESTSTNNYIVFENPYMAGAETNSSGGGMYITTANSYHAQVTLKATAHLEQPLVSYNTTSWSGGGIAIEGLNAKLFIQDETGTSQTLISNNTAVSGGGIHIASSAVVEIYSGKISLNTATNGGGINAEGTCKLNGYVTDNTAESGGGFYIKGGTCTLNGAYVTGNTATSGNGGGFYLEDGILISGTLNLLPNPLLDLLCQISSNTAPNGTGGGIYLTGSTGYTVTFSVNTTISDNSAGNTGGIYLTTSDSPSDSPTSTVTFNAPVLFQNNTNDTDTEVQIWKEGSQGISIFNVSNIVYPSGYSIGESVIAESRDGLRSLPGNEFVLSYSSSPPS